MNTATSYLRCPQCSVEIDKGGHCPFCDWPHDEQVAFDPEPLIPAPPDRAARIRALAERLLTISEQNAEQDVSRLYAVWRVAVVLADELDRLEAEERAKEIEP